MPYEIVRIDTFGVLTTGFRNIRCSIDNTRAVFDLVPELLVPVDQRDIDNARPEMRMMMQGASRVVEAPRALRLELGELLGVAIDTDIDVDLFGGLHANWTNAPRLDHSNAFYPLLEITESPWKAQLPEWRRRDDPDVRHIRMISAECSFDVLGELWSGTWVANAATD